jgi:RimJ/RimL family protein N-acetyltransferase
VFRRSFQFLDPGTLRDGELELVAPQQRWIDAMIAARSHPVTLAAEPNDTPPTVQQLSEYLVTAPSGHVPGDVSRHRVPYYDFWMLVHDYPRQPGAPPEPPPVRIGGTINIRIGSTPALERYYGHIGYHVFPPARGRHFAERACRLLLNLGRRHGLRTLWITCNPANAASRRTLERLGMELVEIVTVPEDEPMYARGEREKCRYRLPL